MPEFILVADAEFASKAEGISLSAKQPQALNPVNCIYASMLPSLRACEYPVDRVCQQIIAGLLQACSLPAQVSN